jgi:transcriptional regulator with XRE-family HTH domain
MKKIVCSNRETIEIFMTPDQQLEDILKNILELRKRKGIKQVDIAKKIDISGAQYGNLESGRNQMTIRQLFRIIDILDVPLNDIFNFPEEIPDSIMKTINELKNELVREKEISILALEKLRSLGVHQQTY